MSLAPVKRKIRSLSRRYREARMVAKALRSPRHPVLVHLIPIRRCNLSCAYCNEYDNFSRPVPTGVLLRRVDLLAALGTTAITLSGGEPLLHPELDRVVRRIRCHGIFATLITNGYLLTPERIGVLNRAGLDYLQISIDNLLPDDVSKKSLKVLDRKLEWLARWAEFEVNINTVIGTAVAQPEDALTVARRARSLGFKITIGILHDDNGQLVPLDERRRAIYDEVLGLSRESFASFAYYKQFQKNLVRGLPNQWHCRAGSRYLYVCEDGLVHYCSQQRGYPGIPLENYSRADLEREYHTVKACAPYCTISCVHQASMLDDLRERPLEALARFFPPRQEHDSEPCLPAGVRVLKWLFLPPAPGSKRRVLTRVFTRAAVRLLSAR